MKTKFTFLLLIAFFICSNAFAQENYTKNQIIVKLKETPNLNLDSDKVTFNNHTLDQLNKTHQITKAKALHKINTNRTFIIEFNEEKNIQELIKEYESSGIFEYVEPNYIYEATGLVTTPQNPTNDPLYNRQWALKNDGTFNDNGAYSVAGADLNIEPAWEIEKGNSNIIVAVLDTGINFIHPEFEGRMWQNPDEEEDDGYELDLFGWNFVDDNNNVFDDQGHGTAVAGVFGAQPDNNIGYAGVDWNCQIMTVKVLNEEGKGSTDKIIEGVYYAVDHGANIINMSLGGPNSSQSFIDAIDYAHLNNVTLIAAMGNDNSSNVEYPAGYEGVIAVGSTDPNDRRSHAYYGNINSGSNYGPHIDVVAPGAYIYILDYENTNNYNKISNGTSLATPFVSGVAALLLAQDPTRTPEQIRQILRATADDQVGASHEDVQGFDIYHGYGRVNAYRALTEAHLSTPDFKNQQVSIYPNPTTDHFFIQNSDYSELKIFSATGKLVHSQDIQTDTLIQQNVKDLSAGIYIVHLKNNKGQVVTKKLIVK